MLSAVLRAKDEVVDAETYASLAAAMLSKARSSDAREQAECAGEVARERLLGKRMMGADCPRVLVAKQHFWSEAGRNFVKLA